MSDSFKLLKQYVLDMQGSENRARVDHLRAAYHMQNMRINRWSYALLSLWFYVPWFVFIWMCGLFSPSLKTRLTGPFLRTFLKSYFKGRGHLPYFSTAQEDIPQKADTPRLIFTLKYSHMSPLFAYQMFTFPVVVPVTPGFDAFVPSDLLPLRIGKLFTHISYQDTSLPYDVENIKTLLKAGHTVVVHLNAGVVNPSHNPMLYIHESFYDLLKLDVESYFLNMGNFDQHAFTSSRSQTLMPVDLVKRDDVVFDIDLNDRPLVNDFVGGFFEHFDVMIVKTPEECKKH
jgi:hypothetical protein